MNISSGIPLIHQLLTQNDRNSNEFLMARECFDLIGVLVLVLDTSGQIVLVNETGCKLLGLPFESLHGKDFFEEFITSGNKQRARNDFIELLNANKSITQARRYELKTAQSKHYIIEAKIMTVWHQETMSGVVISGKDVAEYLKNEQALQYDINLYQILANNIPGINLFLFDQSLKFIIAEGREMKNNGIDSDYFENKTLDQLNDQKLAALWKPVFEEALKGIDASARYSHNNYNYRMWAFPVKSKAGNTESGIAITQNITNDLRTQRKLKKAKEEAEKANQAKSEFLAHVSHEIRTPLNAIVGFAEQLAQTELNLQQHEFVKIIDKSSQHLHSLINDLLILSKIEAREMNFDQTPFKLKQVVEYVFDALGTRAGEKGLDFNFTIDPKINKVIIGDSFRLRQILINMLSNAIKFTSEGGVELRCKLQHDDGTRLLITFEISDTGIGIAPEHLSTIFDQFKQSDTTITKRYGGTGLGLTICKKLIELQQGTLSVESEPAMGSTFTFTLPYLKGKKSDLTALKTVQIDPEVLRNKTILLVDDDSVNRLLALTILEKFNCLVEVADGGKKAIELLRNKAFDVVLLDIHMPGVSGIDVARYLRKDLNNQSTRIIAVTAAVMSHELKTYQQAGINDFLIKPFKEINLFNKICEMLHVELPEQKLVKKKKSLPSFSSENLPYDLSELKSIADGKQQFINNMLTTFIENSRQAVAEMEHLLKEKKYSQLGETAHKILPSYRHLKVRKIVPLLTQIKEQTLIAPNYDQLPQLVEQSNIEIQKLLKILENEVSSL